MTKPEITENDQRLAHTVYDHLVYEVYGGLLTALEESLSMRSQDERFRALADELQVVMDQLDEIIHSTLDTIPGLPSREESTELARKQFDSLALLEGFPRGSMTPEKEIKH